MVCSTQTLANSAGIKVLELGGNCVDAAIAVSAALCVTEPGSTGIGGDMFALYYKAGDSQVFGINGTGRAAKDITIDYVREQLGDKDAKRIPYESIFAVTVPGAIAGWYDSFKEWGSGKVSFEQILQPAIDLAENGFPLGEIASELWTRETKKLLRQNPTDPNPFIINGTTPKEGEIVYNKQVAETLKKIGKDGKNAFYEGPIAESIVKTTSERKHKLSLEDLSSHTSTFVTPIKIEFQDHYVWEIPPNGHGLVALLALGIIQELHESGAIDLYKLEHNSVEYLHLLIEASKLAFHDAEEYVTDAEFHNVPLHELLEKKYLASRAKLIEVTKALDSLTITHGVPDPKFKSDTVYLTVSDSNGDACSFINSVYEHFGTGILADDRGFCLHNRGSNFNLSAGLSNSLEGGKRPYHTIIPGLITRKDGSLFASFGNMGGFAQPVCHLQHVLNLIVFKMTPQQLIDSPRFVLDSDFDPKTDRGRGANSPISTNVTIVSLEEGIPEDVVDGLLKLGHTTRSVTGYARSTFGRAQIIKKEEKDGKFVYAGGSELRSDGAATPLI
jgi:gamma-glutamyltranspeptidase/glutathione hydrolase